MSPENADPSLDELIAVGVVRRPHGIRGEISVEPLTDDPERFHDLRTVWLVRADRSASEKTDVESARVHGGRVLVKLAGVDTPERVRELRDWTIEIAPGDARPLDANEFFLHDLEGLTVVTPAGRTVGTVVSVDEGGGGILLTVAKSGGGSFEMPFASSICTEIDLGARRIVADLPAGLENLEEAEEVEDRNAKAPRQARSAARLRIDFVTIFPSMLEPLLAEGIVARALKGGILAVRTWDLRDFTSDKHRSTDDVAYGGGAGMVMLAEPVFRCLDAIRADGPPDATPVVILTTPQGELFRHETAVSLARERWLVFLCGRYEGFDERVREALVDRELSVGDFVVSGGEIPAMLIADAVARLVEGVVGDWNSVEADSFYGGLLDHPHYTRPAELRGMNVPDVLLSGHAENIRKWRKEQALRATLTRRPDLLETADLDEESRRILDRLRGTQPESPSPKRRKGLKKNDS
ncbi:MAG TPA: tRNA (guanosine(37)-N1)-methyltransferase TrmD [Thermoanaerobaculia bacterium]